jgi:hypothetical protein
MRYQTLADDLHLNAGIDFNNLALVSLAGLHDESLKIPRSPPRYPSQPRTR